MRTPATMVVVTGLMLDMGVAALSGQEVPSPLPPPPGMVLVPAGVFRPPFRVAAQPAEKPVGAFLLDVLPVTNADFLRFLRASPEWQRSKVERRFADASYLKHWAGDLDLGDALTNAPVTHVSWFAARAYARWCDRRLPKLAEWELAAAASATQPDGTREPEFQQRLLRWYSTPAPTRLPAVGSGPANYFGLRDLHGLVWEWVSDFDAPWAGVTMTGADSDKFCGAGALGARDPAAYATFMRYGFRSSLQPDYCVGSLGFRCARNANQAPP